MSQGSSSAGGDNDEDPKAPISTNLSSGLSSCPPTSHIENQNVNSLPENDESPVDLEPNFHTIVTVPPRSHYRRPNKSDMGVKKIAEICQPNGGAISSNSESDSRATVRERNAAMLFSECIADVWFLVGGQLPGTHGVEGGTDVSKEQQQRIPAHSYVLATGSSVFYAMFYGGFTKCDDILVPDVEPTAFKILLKYLYTDEVELDSETVLPTLYVAKKYLVTHLIRACIEFLENSLNAQNVCLLLAQSRLFEEEELMQRCWDVLDAQTELALASDGFLDVDKATLAAIVGRETLSCREPCIFTSCVRWADAECARLHVVDPTCKDKRVALGRCFELIRFAQMKVEELADQVAPSGLLDPAEIADLFLHRFARQKPQLPFVSRPRAKLPVRRCHRFQSSAYRGNQWRYRGRCDSIQFCTDKRVFVVGFGLYGSSNGSAEYKICVELRRSGQTLACTSTRLFTDGSSSVFPVYFDQPVQVEPDMFYTASAVLDGLELSYFGQEGLPEVQNDRVTFQFQCSTESTNGTGVQGGQIPEILFYG